MAKVKIIVRETQFEGYIVIANYKNNYVLAHNETPEVPEPWVTWFLDSDNAPFCGKYFKDSESAERHFAGLCFKWFNDEKTAPPEGDTVEEKKELPHFSFTKEDIQNTLKVMRNQDSSKYETVGRRGLIINGNEYWSEVLMQHFGEQVLISTDAANVINKHYNIFAKGKYVCSFSI